MTTLRQLSQAMAWLDAFLAGIPEEVMVAFVCVLLCAFLLLMGYLEKRHLVQDYEPKPGSGVEL